jgi:hypothetical protein
LQATTQVEQALPDDLGNPLRLALHRFREWQPLTVHGLCVATPRQHGGRDASHEAQRKREPMPYRSPDARARERIEEVH